jgi:hypothetical protein
VIEVKGEGGQLLVGGNALSYDEARDLVDLIWAAIPVELAEDGTPVCSECGVKATEDIPGFWVCGVINATATIRLSTRANKPATQFSAGARRSGPMHRSSGSPRSRPSDKRWPRLRRGTTTSEDPFLLMCRLRAVWVDSSEQPRRSLRRSFSPSGSRSSPRRRDAEHCFGLVFLFHLVLSQCLRPSSSVLQASRALVLSSAGASVPETASSEARGPRRPYGSAA